MVSCLVKELLMMKVSVFGKQFASQIDSTELYETYTKGGVCFKICRIHEQPKHTDTTHFFHHDSAKPSPSDDAHYCTIIYNSQSTINNATAATTVATKAAATSTIAAITATTTATTTTGSSYYFGRSSRGPINSGSCEFS